MGNLANLRLPHRGAIARFDFPPRLHPGSAIRRAIASNPIPPSGSDQSQARDPKINSNSPRLVAALFPQVPQKESSVRRPWPKTTNPDTLDATPHEVGHELQRKRFVGFPCQKSHAFAPPFWIHGPLHGVQVVTATSLSLPIIIQMLFQGLAPRACPQKCR